MLSVRFIWPVIFRINFLAYFSHRNHRRVNRNQILSVFWKFLLYNLNNSRADRRNKKFFLVFWILKNFMILPVHKLCSKSQLNNLFKPQLLELVYNPRIFKLCGKARRKHNNELCFLAFIFLSENFLNFRDAVLWVCLHYFTMFSFFVWNSLIHLRNYTL